MSGSEGTGKKTCYSCRLTLDHSEFNKKASHRDGLASTCKKCSRLSGKASYRKNKESFLERSRVYSKNNREKIRKQRKGYYRTRIKEMRALSTKYAKSEKGKLNASKGMRASREMHPEKVAARRKTRTAIANGSLVKLPCEVCGNPKSEAHHKDYSKPLDVQWLCLLHHRATHGRSAEIKD